jgi:flagellar motor switch protein FliN/FliY
MPELSANQIDAIKELLQRLTPGLSVALSEQINCEATLELTDVAVVPLSELLARTEHVLSTLFTVSHPEGSECLFLLSEETAHTFADLVEGISGGEAAEPLTDAQVDTLTTVMAGFVSGFANAVNNATGDHYEAEAASTQVGTLTVPPMFALEGSATEVKFAITMGEGAAELTALFTSALLAELVPAGDGLPLDAGGDDAQDEDDEAIADGELEDDATAALKPALAPSAGLFPDPPSRNAGSQHMRGLEMILDIPLDVTVELGRVRMLIKDVLELASGSIIELDRIAGEPVDLLVNGRLVAKGEVVVIEDNFGLRITEIASPADRVAGLGKGAHR